MDINQNTRDKLVQECLSIQEQFLKEKGIYLSLELREQFKEEMDELFVNTLTNATSIEGFSENYQKELESLYDSFSEDNDLEEKVAGEEGNISLANNPLRMYLKEISKLPLLTSEEEQCLLMQISEGVAGAKEKMIERNLRLVVSVAKKYFSRVKKMDPFDLIQNGNMGLMEAVERFDLSKGAHFSTYAIYWIKNKIKSGIQKEENPIYYPGYVIQNSNNYSRLFASLQKEFGRAPGREELAKHLNVSLEQVLEYEKYFCHRNVGSLNEKISSDDSESLEIGDFVFDNVGKSVEETVIDAVVSTEVEQMLVLLSEKEREVLTLVYGLDPEKGAYTQSEIARMKNISRQSVNQLEMRALKKLRYSKYRNLLGDESIESDSDISFGYLKEELDSNKKEKVPSLQKKKGRTKNHG